MMASIIDQIIGFPDFLLRSFAPRTPPEASIFIALITILITVGTNLLTLKLVDVEKLRLYKQLLSEHNKLRMQVLKTADKRLQAKSEKEEPRMKKIQSEYMQMTMRPMLFTFIPLIIFFISMSGFYNTKRAFAAIVPFGLPESLLFPIGKNLGNGLFLLNFVWFYFAVSIVFNSIIRKILRLD